MSEHTPGPWTVGHFVDPVGGYQPQEQGVYEIEEANERINGWRQDGEHLCAEQEANANARLIAAAPDLLAALEDALSGWRYIRKFHGDLDGVGWDRVEVAARDAIAKATRGQR